MKKIVKQGSSDEVNGESKPKPTKTIHSFHHKPVRRVVLYGTMAALLPTILSDDEDEAANKAASIKKSSIGGGSKKTKKRKQQSVSQDEESDGDDAEEMDGDFEFGGLLVRSIIMYFF